MLQNTLKQLKKKDRTKILKQLSADLPTGCNVSTRNPAVTSEMLKRITYIRMNADKLNPTELNEALQMLGFPMIDSWNPTIIDEQRRLICSYLNERMVAGNPVTLNIIGNLTPEVTGLKVTMNPIQDLSHGGPSPTNICPISGRDSVTVTRTGKNLCPLSEFIDTSPRIPLKAGNYTFSFVFRGVPQYSTSVIALKEFVSGTAVVSVNVYHKTDGDYCYASFTLAEDTDVRVARENVNTGTSGLRASSIQIELGSTATAYEPYQAETHSHTYASAVYGGVDDFVSGEGSNEWGYIASYNGETLPGEWISDRDAYAPNTSPTTGAEVVYKLATPTTLTNTPEDISLLKGVNLVSTDGDSIVLKYKLSLT